MQPDRGIVHIYRRSYGLSTRTDDLNALNHQSAGVLTMPPGNRFTPPLYEILPVHGLYLIYVYGYIYATVISVNVKIASITTPLRQDPKLLMRQLSNVSAVIGIGGFTLVTISDLIILPISDLIRLTVIDLI